MIAAQVELTQALRQQRQFVARTGSGHNLILDDAAGGTGAKPIETVAVGLAGCTAFDVITVLRQKYHQKVTAYQVRVEADQAARPPQVFTTGSNPSRRHRYWNRRNSPGGSYPPVGREVLLGGGDGAEDGHVPYDTRNH